MNQRKRGFTIYEAILTLALIGLVLDLVAQGYQRLTTINQLSLAASHRTQQLAQLQTMSAQIATCYAYTIVGPQQLRLNVVDPNPARLPNLDLSVTQADRLPWPVPLLPIGTPDIPAQRDPYLLTNTFIWQAGTAGTPGQIALTTAPGPGNPTPPSSITYLDYLSDFLVQADASLRMIHIAVTPYQANSALNATVFLPLVPGP